jgi:hypothetical protein
MVLKLKGEEAEVESVRDMFARENNDSIRRTVEGQRAQE